jgi:transposase
LKIALEFVRAANFIRSRLGPFCKLAKTFGQYWNSIVSYFQCQITQRAIEAINGIIQLAKRRTRGFRNFSYLRAIAYLSRLRSKCLFPLYYPLKRAKGQNC